MTFQGSLLQPVAAAPLTALTCFMVSHSQTVQFGACSLPPMTHGESCSTGRGLPDPQVVYITILPVHTRTPH